MIKNEKAHMLHETAGNRVNVVVMNQFQYLLISSMCMYSVTWRALTCSYTFCVRMLPSPELRL
jgi:hypothetical protein